MLWGWLPHGRLQRKRLQPLRLEPRVLRAEGRATRRLNPTEGPDIRFTVGTNRVSCYLKPDYIILPPCRQDIVFNRRVICHPWHQITGNSKVFLGRLYSQASSKGVSSAESASYRDDAASTSSTSDRCQRRPRRPRRDPTKGRCPSRPDPSDVFPVEGRHVVRRLLFLAVMRCVDA